MNATTISPGEKLNITVSILNSLPQENTVRPANDWLFKGVPVALWPPCYFGLPAQMVILKGNYTLQDLRAVAETSYGYVCMEGVSVDHVIFQPNSDEVRLTGLYDVTGTNQTLGPFNMSLSFATGGYWDIQNLSRMLNHPILGDGGNPKVPPPYIPFAPGVYTIAVADEWGQAAVLHVTVAGNPSQCCSSAPGGVQLASIVMVGPYTPAGPTVALTLRNEMGCCITNLTAILGLNENYTFRFGSVSASHPLGEGMFASAIETLIGAGFNSNTSYPLTIKGTTQDTVFTYAMQTSIPPAYSPLFYITAAASCTSSGVPTPCWGDDPFVFQCFNLVSGPATQWTCTEKVTSSSEPGQSYAITVNLPVANQSGEPAWDNCEWSVPGISPGQGYAYCIPTSSTGGSLSFIVADLAPPHL
ncbi:MAG: hypothetical protein JRN11_07270 [Nitrososphaerota archaeon]|nr:hypothetical protein [Nitrososphaerota archaeon]MDG7013239.1 hypothetical protein [Nitrososphaerota archaeon]MDG7026530.1 hypothetical protein [Nitrososphaerota archaeon]